MRKDHVVFDFIKIPISNKIEYGRYIINKMTSNDYFTSPDITLTDLKAVTDLLESRCIASAGGGKENTALLHQTEEKWNDTMRIQARYVDRIANGIGTMIISAGFNLAKPRIPGKRSSFKVELGKKSGTVILRCKAVVGAKSYIWQYCIGEAPNETTNWVTALVTTKAMTELSGLTPLTRYWFRVGAVTTQGIKPYSTPIMQGVV